MAPPFDQDVRIFDGGTFARVRSHSWQMNAKPRENFSDFARQFCGVSFRWHIGCHVMARTSMVALIVNDVIRLARRSLREPFGSGSTDADSLSLRQAPGRGHEEEVLADSQRVNAKAAELRAQSCAIWDSARETVARARNDCQVGVLRRAVRERLAKLAVKGQAQ